MASIPRKSTYIGKKSFVGGASSRYSSLIGGGGDDLNSLCDEAKQELEDYAEEKKQQLEDDKEYYEKSKKSRSLSNPTRVDKYKATINSLTRYIKDAASQYIFDNIMNFAMKGGLAGLGSLSGSGAGKEFARIMTDIALMFLMDKHTLFNFIDYSKVALKKRIDRAQTNLNNLQASVDLFFSNYDKLTPAIVQDWLQNYLTYVSNANAKFKEATEHFKLVQGALDNSGQISDHNKIEAMAKLQEGIDNLLAFRTDDSISSIVYAKEEADSYLKRLRSDLRYINSAKVNHQNLPKKLENFKVKQTYGVHTLSKAINTLDNLTSDIDDAIAETDNLATVLCRAIKPWVVAADTAGAMLLQLNSDVEPDTTKMQQLAQISQELESTVIEDDYTVLSNDILYLTTILSSVLQQGNYVNVTRLKARINNKISILRAKLQSIETSLQIPDEISSEVADIARRVGSRGFDAMLQALLSGNILQFLLGGFKNSTKASRFVSLIERFNALGVTPESLPELVEVAFHSQQMTLRKEFADVAETHIPDEYRPQNAEDAKQKLDEIKDKATQSVEEIRSGSGGPLTKRGSFSGFSSRFFK